MKNVHITLSKNNSIKNCINISESDLNINTNIYKTHQIEPESLTEVSCDMITQKSHLIRYVFKQLDVLLKVGGSFKMFLIDSKFHSGYFLSKDQVKYEFGISTNGGYSLIKEQTKDGYLILKFIKKQNILEINDSINKWSFGIPSGGKKDHLVTELIQSIEKQKIPNYEIIICGQYQDKKILLNQNIKVLDDVKLKDDIRIPICHKKNKIIKYAKYENLCILHDRFSLGNNWFTKMKAFGNYFDFLCLPTIDSNGNRFPVDWMKFTFPLIKRNFRNLHIPYDKWHPDLIIQGGVILGKKSHYLRSILDERIYWGEIEDLHFSKTAYLNGSFFGTDCGNFFISESVNQLTFVNIDSFNYKLKNYIKWYYSLIVSYLNFNKMKNNYLNKINTK